MSKIWLRSVLILSGVLLIFTSGINAQNRDRPTWFSIYAGHNEYHGDLGNEILGFDFGYDWTLGLAVDQYLNNYLDLEISGIYGELDYDIFFNTSFLSGQAILQFKPARDRLRVDPFIGTGIGITGYWNNSSDIQNGTTFHLPLQLGVDLQITNRIASTLNATYNRTFTNNIDGSSFGNRDHDDFMIYSVGIKFSLNKTRDSDGDGVSNKDDLCPNLYGESFWGCPDSDGDSIEDNEDNCPSVPGSRTMNGCPDSDGDGVDNSIDLCPDESGSYQFNGCPENTNEGIPNQISESNTNSNDRGVDSKIANKLAEFAGNITFATNSSSLDSTSRSNLDQLANIMLNDQALQLIIRAYTDNTGNPNTNLELSVARANAVKTYLAEKGVDTNRLYAFGYGQEKPIASNITQEGREKNRRIELHLYHKQ